MKVHSALPTCSSSLDDFPDHSYKKDASFAENFYGLKRRRRPIYVTERATAAVGGIPVQERLGRREVIRSLIFLVRLASLKLSRGLLILICIGRATIPAFKGPRLL